MKPPNQPDPRESGYIMQRLLIITIRQQFENVALRLTLRRLMTRLKLHLLVRVNKAYRS